MLFVVIDVEFLPQSISLPLRISGAETADAECGPSAGTSTGQSTALQVQEPAQHSAETRQRLKHTLLPLQRFPLFGVLLEGRWSGYRFVLGPWRWMIVAYAYIEADRVVIVTVQDGRSSRFAS